MCSTSKIWNASIKWKKILGVCFWIIRKKLHCSVLKYNSVSCLINWTPIYVFPEFKALVSNKSGAILNQSKSFKFLIFFQQLEGA